MAMRDTADTRLSYQCIKLLVLGRVGLEPKRMHATLGQNIIGKLSSQTCDLGGKIRVL